MDTLDTVKSSRRQQAAGGEMCAWPIASFGLKGWRAKTTCSGHNPLTTNGLTKEGMSDHCIFHSNACAVSGIPSADSHRPKFMEAETDASMDVGF